MLKKVNKAKIPGMFLLEPVVHEDIRGRLTKTYHTPTFNKIEGLLAHNWGEVILSDNFQKGVFRGLHFQKPPYAQAKTLCCVTGAIKDWALDLRVGSPTYGEIEIFSLNSTDRQILYVPEGIANGYYTIEEGTTILYNLTSEFNADASGGITWKSVGLDLDDAIVAEKDNLLEDWGFFESPFTFKKED